jgi:magnesium transporter
MIIDFAHYHDGRRRDEGAVPLAEAAARSRQGGFVWLGLSEPGEEELAQVRDTFGLHELAVEDAQNLHMRPKIESYDQDVQLVILRTARYDDAAEEVEFGQISIFLAPAFVITVRRGVASELHGARQRLEQRPELLAAGGPAALWAILDQVVDDYAPVVAGLDHDIDQVEATVFSGVSAPTERIYSLRREATGFYRAVHPLLAVVVTAIERTTAAPQLQPYIRDVHDHLLLVNEEAAAQRDLLGTVLEANMAVISVEETKVSVQQNSTIEQLTILATVFLPLTFVTGFFGLGFPSQRGEILLRERSSPMGETRRKFDKDFREGAVRLVRETGKPIAQVARDLGINSGTLGNWVDADRRRRGEGDGALSEDERAELARLRKENAELAMRCDVLKRSVALWVSDAMGR